MESAIKNLLERVEIDKKCYSYFEDGKNLKVKYHKEKKLYNVEMELLAPLPVAVYVNLLTKVKDYLNKSAENVEVALYIHALSNLNNAINIKDYINYYIDTKLTNKDDFMFIKKQSISIRNDELNIKFDSVFVEDSLNELKPKLERFIQAAGYENIKIKCVYIEKEADPFDYERDKAESEAIRARYNELKAEEEKQKKAYEASEKAKKPFVRTSFKNKKFTRVELDEIPADLVDIEAEVFVFDVIPEGKSNKRFKINVTNYKTSYTCHIWTNRNYSPQDVLKTLNKYIVIRGTISFNQFDKENSIELFNFEILDKTNPVITDDEEVKRVELHAHTNMSAMDGICDVSQLVKEAARFGHKAIAITDHVAVQSFPDAQRTQKALKKAGTDIKILYGVELNTVPKQLEIVKNPANINLKDAEYVFFDLETSGLSSEFDEIIEFGAVKTKNGVEQGRIDLLIYPGHPISEFTTSLTNITNDMLKGKPTIKEVIPEIMEFLGDAILVAHNATFDVGFIEHAIGHELKNPIIDTLPLSRFLYQNEKRYNLGTICRSQGIDYDEESAHRGDYDALVLKELYDVILSHLVSDKIATTHEQLSKLQSPEVTRKMHTYHTNILVSNMVGMKNLFKILSIANTDYYTNQPLVPPHIIDEHREGLLIGSSCARGEIFELASTKSKKEVIEAMKWYDYIELQPLDQYQILVDTERVASMDKVKQIIRFIIECANSANKMIVATGDSHYIWKEQHIAREVFISTPAIGGGFHPLYDFKNRIKSYPMQEFKTTRQMLDAFEWLGKDVAYEYVVTNTNKINDMIEYCYPIKDKLYPPSIPDSNEQLEKSCYETAHKMYGKDLPEIVSSRLEHELKCIIGNGYSIMYVIAAKCVKKSNEDGYLVGSRGSVGSSFVATCSGITEVNPLPPHYRCPNCGYNDFNVDSKYRSGYDLPDKNCPVCNSPLKGDGHNIPFETFLGFNGDKVPDIDLNFSSLNQATSHLFIREMFGEDHVFRAGTISTAASKTAFGYAKKYYEKVVQKEISNAEAARIAKMCEGVKRTTGQHPGGLIVIPNDMDVYDFTAVCHPADDMDSDWLTTHFAFESIHDNVLKLDMLGHVDPTAIRMLQNLTKIDPHNVPMNDEKVLAQFNGDAKIDDPDHLTAVGLPEFGTSVSRKMLIDSKPKTFADLTKVSGLSHGTDVFFGNARDLIIDGTCTIENCIGCRDDIMLGLMSYGVEPLTSFKIMESVRKGKGLTPEMEQAMHKQNVPEWYFDACRKIKYMFPKAHAVAYCMMSVRIAWFKMYYPLEYYATYFTTRSDAFDIESMIAGIDTIKQKFNDLENIKAKTKLSVKEAALDTFYEVCIEMYARGISFSNIQLDKSLDYDFSIDYDKKEIIPPFRVCDGIGQNAAQSVVEARKEGPFVSKEDLIARTKLNGTNIKLLEKLGVTKGLNETAQLSLFNF